MTVGGITPPHMADTSYGLLSVFIFTYLYVFIFDAPLYQTVCGGGVKCRANGFMILSPWSLLARCVLTLAVLFQLFLNFE